MQVCRRPLRAGLLFLVSMVAGGAAGQTPDRLKVSSPDPTAKYFNTALPTAERVADLVSRMTLEEKISQMQDEAVAIPRLGIPRYGWWNEGLHGVAFSGYATNFPQAIGLAATWDTDLVHRVAGVISTEARAKYNAAIALDNHRRFFGLSFWSPNVNIFRDPRWGRGQETYGEDPFLTSRIAVAFVTGMQGDDPRYLKVVSTPKHFAVHSGPEPTRHRVNIDVSPHDLEDTYLPAFRAAITEAHADSIMCAYNSIDGSPACTSDLLLGQHLRRSWGFQGYVVSDCDAVNDVWHDHKFVADAAHAAALAVKAGDDLDCGDAYASLKPAVTQGLLTEADLDIAVKRLFTARFRLGMFDPPAGNPYSAIKPGENNTPEHRQLALQAAREAIVLLKNDGAFLPLEEKIQRIAVIGPNAEYRQSIEGNYNGAPPQPVTPLAGIEKQFAGKQVMYAQGSPLAEGAMLPISHTAIRHIVPPGRDASGHTPVGTMADLQSGLVGQYFNNPNLAGQPIATRVDKTINFNWNDAEPIPGIGTSQYSVRWTGVFVPPAVGDYKIGVRISECYACESSEEFRLYLDDTLVAGSSKRGETPAQKMAASFTLHTGDMHPRRLALEYIHHDSGGQIDLQWDAPRVPLRDEAVGLAKDADVVVAVVGIAPTLEGEEMGVNLEGFKGGDRTSIDLPRPQEELLEALAATGKPVIVVLLNGSALSVNWAAQHAKAILDAWYPGEEGGTAIAETLAGVNNPAGRLPITFYKSIDQLPAFEEYGMAGRTYRYFKGQPLYGFGYGLSYSRFTYSGLKVSATRLRAGSPLKVEADIKNTSSRGGDEVAEVYLTSPQSAIAPVHAMVGFTRVAIGAGQTKHVTFELSPRQLSQVSTDGSRSVAAGEYELYVGGSQPVEGGTGAHLKFTIEGTAPLPQ
ncbi:MAG TPA: glycoside hydrolase family 3 C-terminal domain-containing protein [Acidisarcina sp.]